MHALTRRDLGRWLGAGVAAAAVRPLLAEAVPAAVRLSARPRSEAGGRRGSRLRLQSQQPHGKRDAEGPDGRVPPGIVERGAGRRGLPPLRGRSGLRERPAAGEDAPRPDRDAHVLEDLRHGRSPARICGRAASGDREARSAGGVGFGQRDRAGRGAGERGRRSLGGAGPQAKRSHPRSGRCGAGPSRVHHGPLAGALRDDRHAARGETADRGVAPARRRGRPAVPGNAQTPARHSGKTGGNGSVPARVRCVDGLRRTSGVATFCVPLSIRAMSRSTTGQGGNTTMKYLLLIYENEKRWETSGYDPKEMAEYRAFGKEFAKAILGGNALKPTAPATTVTVRDGKRLTTDAPVAGPKEQLGGSNLIEAERRPEARHVAGKIPGARFGSIEVRPIMTFDS